jgi:nitroimidazol reductase NimA-like FMN-containing flavoprotein (pyridoxamine 5'-phosphate oxidase superfamily)
MVLVITVVKQEGSFYYVTSYGKKGNCYYTKTERRGLVITLLRRIPEAQAQISARRSATLNKVCSWLSSVPLRKCWDSTLN